MVRVQQGVRQLARLYAAGSTARVINLAHVAAKAQRLDESLQRPMFRNERLNSAFIVRHHLRREEQDFFETDRVEATKIILPIDQTDMRVGGRFVFVGAQDWRRELTSGVSSEIDSVDFMMLEHIAKLPSFDVFILKSWLEKIGHHVDAIYYELNEATLAKIYSILRQEMTVLISIALGDLASTSATDVLVGKLMAPAAGGGLEPLQRSLKIEQNEFDDCLFSWKGFIYYKSRMNEITQNIKPYAQQVSQWVRHPGRTKAEREMLERLQNMISRRLLENIRMSENLLNQYNESYRRLTVDKDPVSFREFLLRAPAMFEDLGGALGRVEHVVQFWNYRRGQAPMMRRQFDEDVDLLREFCSSLGL